MLKHHDKNHHEKNAGAEILGTPNELINLLVADKEENEWAVAQVINEGPAHKQLYSALLLKRMYKLVDTISKNAGEKFSAQKGYDTLSKKHEHELTVPVQLPASAVGKVNSEAILELASHAPEHELVAFNTLLQAIEWSIKAVAKNNAD